MTIECFNEQRTTQIEKIREELLNGIWKPMPYMQVYVPKTKDPAEKRTLAMAAVRDKVVQQALRGIIEPKIEHTLFPNSYAYRPHKGALKAIKYAIRQSGNLDNGYALRLDVDDFFDNIDHAILQKRLTAVGVDTELVRLSVQANVRED